MASALFVDSVPQISMFYGSVARVSQHFTCYLECTKGKIRTMLPWRCCQGIRSLDTLL